jgi:Leucine-rich repeat (LRR) protein
MRLIAVDVEPSVSVFSVIACSCGSYSRPFRRRTKPTTMVGARRSHRLVLLGHLRLLILVSLVFLAFQSTTTTCRGRGDDLAYASASDYMEADNDDGNSGYLYDEDDKDDDEDDDDDMDYEIMMQQHHQQSPGARGSSSSANSKSGVASSSTSTSSNSFMDFQSLVGDEDWEVTLQEDAQGNYHLLFEREGGDIQRSVPLNEEFNSLSEEEIIQLAIDFFDQHIEDVLYGDDDDDDDYDEATGGGDPHGDIPAERRQRERTALSIFFTEINGTVDMKERGGWLSPDLSVCEWSGIRCGPILSVDVTPYPYNPFETTTTRSSNVNSRSHHQRAPPEDAVTAIALPQMQLNGTLPTQLSMLEYLTKLNLEANQIHGTIPESLAYLARLRVLDLSDNQLAGSIPSLLGVKARDLKQVLLSRNRLTGKFPTDLRAWRKLLVLDFSNNQIQGTLPKQLGLLTHLLVFNVGDNLLTGSFPTTFGQLNDLHLLDAAGNLLTGPLPSDQDFGNFPLLEHLDLSDNDLRGTFPPEMLLLENLQTVSLSNNLLHGTLPRRVRVSSGEKDQKHDDYSWSNLHRLGLLHLDHNDLTGTVPSTLYSGLRRRLGSLDLSYNRFNGTIATQIGHLTAMHTLKAMSNQLGGTLPTEMLKLNPNLRLNLTDNLLTGSIPGMFCGHGAVATSMLYTEFGCDAVLCRAGTFNVHGHATLHSACRPCPNLPKGQEHVLGRIRCLGLPSSSPQYVHGDLDGDGLVSPREILRLIYIDNLGRFWGPSFQTWADIKVSECDLTGVTCVKGRVAKIDLSNANMCSNGDRQPGPIQFCLGLPSEIGELSSLEVFQANRRQFLRGTIPTEFGRLSRLRVLDLSSCPSMSGTIPTELAQVPLLKYLILSHSPFKGAIPSGLFQLTMLEKLSLTNNYLTGTLPTTLTAVSLKELMISRNGLRGTIPTQIGHLIKLENFEGYGNQLTGAIPSELSECTNLKRIDLFNNELTGTIPLELSFIDKLQILHLKENKLTGSIPKGIGDIPSLSWFDISHNMIYGTIPQQFASSATIKDFRIGSNMIYGPIPKEMCSNKNINGGSTDQYDCNGVACALGTFSSMGHAIDSEGGCTKCPDGESTLYLGSTKCVEISIADILSIFFDVMHGDSLWPPAYIETWQQKQLQPKDNSDTDGDIGNKEQPTDNVCHWQGVRCDENGQVISLSFPLIGSATDSYLSAT